ncbi:MAG: prepilin peptidase [bacterium]|nr:prepilin peptidase [bacterium]
MEIMFFIIGLIFGSFYNVVGLRLPNNESIIKPGSHCPKCKHKLSWYENIPVISYIFLRGKCKNCKQKISFIYPAIELLTGILFLSSYLVFGLTYNCAIAIILSSLVSIIFVSDSKYMIINDSPLLISGILIVIIKIISEGLKEGLYSILSGLLIFGIVYALMLLGNFLFKRESLGGGDIKLSFIAGLSLGPSLGIFYIILASFLAFPYAMYISVKGEEGMLPFGPFLATSMLLLYFNSGLAQAFINALLGL